MAELPVGGVPAPPASMMIPQSDLRSRGCCANAEDGADRVSQPTTRTRVVRACRQSSSARWLRRAILPSLYYDINMLLI